MGYVNFQLRDDIHKQFKINSIEEGKEMQEILVDLVKDYLKRRGKLGNSK